MIKVSANSVSGEGSLPGLLTVSAHGLSSWCTWRMREVSGISSSASKGTSPVGYPPSMISFNLNDLPKGSISKHHHMGG